MFVKVKRYCCYLVADFGVKIEPIVSAGQLVPFELLAPLMESETKACKAPAGWLLDGKEDGRERNVDFEGFLVVEFQDIQEVLSSVKGYRKRRPQTSRFT